MARFQIPKLSPTVNKTIRFPEDVVDSVEDEIKNTGCTFSGFVIEAVRVALKTLEEDRESEKQKDK